MHPQGHLKRLQIMKAVINSLTLTWIDGWAFFQPLQFFLFLLSHEFKSRFRVDFSKWDVPRWRRHLVIEITNFVLRCFVLCVLDVNRVTTILALTEKKPNHLFVEKSLSQALIIKQTTFYQQLNIFPKRN